MSAEDRKVSIVKASIPLFAELGFKGTTTRKIADAAGISEALLYKHFPSKDELYKSIQDSCFSVKSDTLEKLFALEDSTENLIFCIYFYIRRSLKREYAEKQYLHLLDRLSVYSTLEDGEFIKTLRNEIWQPWFEKTELSFKVALAKNDIKVSSKNSNPLWYIHHQIITVLLLRLAPQEIIDYELSNDELISEILDFSLRGLGLNPEIKYDIKELSSFYEEKFISLAE